MTEEGALRAIRINAAEVLDLGSRVGALGKGKDAVAGRYPKLSQLDSTFGIDGAALLISRSVTTAFGSSSAFISATAVQSDGKIVAVGFGNRTTIVRYLGQ
jgi:hypothetical protein